MKFVNKPVIEIEESDKEIFEQARNLLREAYYKFGYNLELLDEENQIIDVDISETINTLNILMTTFSIQKFE